MRSVIIFMAGLAAVGLPAFAVRAEDFSVHLNDVAAIDATRPMPVYELGRVLRQSEGELSSDMPEKWFDVFIRFKDFGDVRLGEACEAGPSTGKSWAKGRTFRSGLADLEGVKIAWIKDSPDLVIVAWVNEPDGRGNGNTFAHGHVILQLRGRRAQVLIRGADCISAHVNQGCMLTSSHFSFNAKDGFLQERIARYYEKSAHQPHDLGHLWKDEGGNNVFTAGIHETITLSYKLAGTKLVPASCNLVYKTQEQDELSQIAHFYLGPLAPRRVLLGANANLAARYKDTHPGTMIYLDAGLEINVPVPEKWVIASFAHGLTMKEKD